VRSGFRSPSLSCFSRSKRPAVRHRVHARIAGRLGRRGLAPQQHRPAAVCRLLVRVLPFCFLPSSLG
jgi:hypothetical protein